MESAQIVLKLPIFFLTLKNDYITDDVIKMGMAKLEAWYIAQGYVLMPIGYEDQDGDGQPEPVKFQFDIIPPSSTSARHLYIKCAAVKVSGFELVANDSHGETFLNGEMNEAGEMSEGHASEIMAALTSSQEMGGFLDTYNLERILTIFRERYMVEISMVPALDDQGKAIVDANGAMVVRLVVRRPDYLNLNYGIGGDTTGLYATGGYQHVLPNDMSLSPSFGVTGMPMNTAMTGSVSLSQPWIDNKGTQMEEHVSATWLPFNDNYNSQSIGVGFSTPIGKPGSQWSVLYGLDLEHLANQLDDPTFWLKPTAGVRYVDPKSGCIVEVKAGPRISFNGEAYVELSVKVSKNTYLTKNHKIYIRTAAGASVRFGANPGDITSWTMSPLGPLSVNVWGTAGLLFVLDKKGQWAVGPGLAATTNDLFGTPVIAGGIYLYSPVFKGVGGVGLSPTGVRPSIVLEQ